MNNRQRSFAQEYIVDLNATQAAIRAGYSAKTARIHASRLLTNVDIQENIREAMQERSERTNIRADRVLTELAKIGFANMLDYIDVDAGDGLEAYGRQDFDTALRLFKSSEESKKDAFSQSMLGFMYSEGEGVLQDYKKSEYWYSLSAEQGNEFAQYNLGFSYTKGQGVLQNYTLAHMWYNISASLGDEVATKNRKLMEKKMTPDQVDRAQELARKCVSSHYEDCG